MAKVEKQEMDVINEWFRERGFTIKVVLGEGGEMWAALGRLPSGRLVAPQYGRGTSEIAAARRAKERYEQEEEGTPS